MRIQQTNGSIVDKTAAEIAQEIRDVVNALILDANQLDVSVRQNQVTFSSDAVSGNIAGKSVNLVNFAALTSKGLSFVQPPTTDQNKYYLEISGGPARYEIVPHIGQQSPEGNNLQANPYLIADLVTFQPETQTINPPTEGSTVSDSSAAWYSFSLSESGAKGSGIGIRAIRSVVVNGTLRTEPDLDNVLKLELYNSAGTLLSTQSMLVDSLPDSNADFLPETVSSGIAELDFEGLAAGNYLIRVSAAKTTYVDAQGIGYEKPLADLTKFEVYSTSSTRITLRPDFDYGRNNPVDLGIGRRYDRRDVILGGTGNDRLAGGSGEDWIFGNAGNDVLTGGKDQQAEDLLFGGSGDDSFQITTIRCPSTARRNGRAIRPRPTCL